MKRNGYALALLLTLSAATCAARRPALQPPALIAQAQELAAEDRSAALKMLEDYLQKSPDPQVAPWALLWAGEQRRLSGDAAGARHWFEALARDYAEHPLHNAARLGMAVVDASANPSGNTLATLQLLGEDGVPDTLNADRYRILARVAADDGSPARKVQELAKKADAFSKADPTVQARVQATLGDLLGGASSAPAASAEEDMLRGARLAMQQRQHAEAIRLTEAFLAAWPGSARAAEVRYIQRRAQAGDRVNPRKVGVMLPLTGEYAPAATRIKQAIQLGNEAAGRPMDLVFADAGADPAQAVSELERLVLEEGCVAILGPLLKEVTLPVAEAAQALNVPLVSLSQSGEPTQAGEFVFRGFLPLSQQIEALVDHAVDERGFQRFAMLYPDTPYGQNVRELFEAEVTRRGGQVVHAVSYNPEANVFLDVARRLGDKARGSGGSKSANNPPTIDYDALFIPDNYQQVALIASSLAYEEFPVGSFRPSRALDPLPLLGLNAWNNPKIVEAGGQYVQGAVFVDAFLPSDQSGAVQRFVENYQAAYERPPGVIDAVSYDAARLLGLAMKADDDTREGLRQALSRAELPDPVGGGARFGADREVDRDLLVLTVTRSGIQPWNQPEEGLPP